MSDNPKTRIDMQGAQLEFDLPQGATVTGAIGIINYQYIHGDEVREGTLWSISPMSRPQSVGMMRLATLAIEGTNQL